MIKSKEKILKVIVSMLCIITMIMPHSIAVAEGINLMSINPPNGKVQNETTATITISKLHEGGPESTGTLSDTYKTNYDETRYAYKIKDVNVLKLVEALTTGNNFNNAIFCLRGQGSFPITEDGQPAYATYTYRGSLRETNQYVSDYKTKFNISDANFKALLCLFDNIILRHQLPEQKDELLAKAFAEKIAQDEANNVIPKTTVEMVKSFLTDDDIEVVEQWAIWYFTDADNEKYHNATIESSFGAMLISTTGDTSSFNGISSTRQEYAAILYKYLVEDAIARANDTTNSQTPTLTSPNKTSQLENEYYVVGPIKLDTGNIDVSNFSDIKIIDQAGNEIPRSSYDIKIEGQSGFTNKNINEIFNENYYIYIPIQDNTITSLKIKAKYNTYITTPSLWTPELEAYQPIVTLERELTPMPLEVDFDIENKTFDLALRKFIVKYGETSTDRTRNPNIEGNIDVTDLASGDAETAEYYHAKNPLTVKNGDKVIYQINVYNEGDIDGAATQIKDYLPEGLSYVPRDESTINTQYGWVISPDGRTATTAYTANMTLKAFNKQTQELDSAYVQIECIVDDDVEPGTILTNVAEITADMPEYIADRDSTPGNIVPTSINSQSYIGNQENDTNLSKTNYFYKGQEDDDDFEKVIVIKNTKYDLALKKFIAQVNNDKTNREPKVTIPDNLGKDDSVHDAIYETNKNPLIVEIGDTIIYTIRVYNEGTEDGIASLIYDYVPEGLEFVEDSEINKTYKWKKSEGSNTRYETDYLKDTIIPAFDGEKISYVDVQMECKIVADITAENQKLKNIATIAEDDGDDGDSTPGEITPETYPDNNLEDDDDFEIVEIPGKEFDLSLQKFITKVNNEDYKNSREPKVKVDKLRQGTSKTAEYEQVKTPVTVQIGDIIIYTIRVYNEGDISGYAEEVADILPEGLGFLMNHKVNVDNYWAIPSNSTSIKLTDIANGTKNVTIDDFVDVTALENVEVIPGKVKVTSTKLKYNENDDSNLIEAFDKENPNSTLDYKDIQIACILIGSNSALSYKNLAEVEKDLDENGKEIPDRDSVPGNVEQKPGEDDDDYEIVTLIPKKFDLALRKFITKVDNEDITSRIPQVAVDTDGNIGYVHPKDPVSTANGQLVTYTIRVFNEGEVDGYASEITDNIPAGLEFIPGNEVNKKYGWIMYDAQGNETTDITKATSIKTDYLSKEKSEARNENCLIKAFDESKGISNDPNNPNPDYRDVQVVFKVVEDNVNSDRIITNIAKVTKMHDKDGNPTIDEDEDDLTDEEHVKVKYFDLALKKITSKVIVIEGNEINETITNYTGYEDPEPIVKVEINRKKLNSTIVKFVYTIRITNEGEIPGYATEIKDYIPEGLAFDQEDNKMWSEISDGVIATNALMKTLLQPGESADVQVTLRWINSENNLGEKVNVAEISEDYNIYNSKDIDSTPDNKVEGEDDIDQERVILAISTGIVDSIYAKLAFGILIIVAAGIILIKKYVM